MSESPFDTLARALATGLPRRTLLKSLAGTVGVAFSGRRPRESKAAAKRVGARCTRHKQCSSGLCESTTGTCVAQCATPGEACAGGGICQQIGTGSSGNACLLFPADFNCTGYTPCTWNDRAKDPAETLSCPRQPGYICSVTGLCSGPEEVCLPLATPGEV